MWMQTRPRSTQIEKFTQLYRYGQHICIYYMHKLFLQPSSFYLIFSQLSVAADDLVILVEGWWDIFPPDNGNVGELFS